LNSIRTSTIINKGTDKLNNQKYFQSYRSYLTQKNKTYNRNLAVSNDTNKNLYKPTPTSGLYSTPYNAISQNNEPCCNNVVKTYNNHNSGKTQITRKMWGSMDASSRIQERKMAAINNAAINANKNAAFSKQGNAMRSALEYSGRTGVQQTVKNKYYGKVQRNTDISLFRKPGSFTTPNVNVHMRPIRQSNNLIKMPITPQLSVADIATKYNKTISQVLNNT
jgi:hypothetical protein